MDLLKPHVQGCDEVPQPGHYWKYVGIFHNVRSVKILENIRDTNPIMDVAHFYWFDKNGSAPRHLGIRASLHKCPHSLQHPTHMEYRGHSLGLLRPRVVLSWSMASGFWVPGPPPQQMLAIAIAWLPYLLHKEQIPGGPETDEKWYTTMVATEKWNQSMNEFSRARSSNQRNMNRQLWPPLCGLRLNTEERHVTTFEEVSLIVKMCPFNVLILKLLSLSVNGIFWEINAFPNTKTDALITPVGSFCGKILRMREESASVIIGITSFNITRTYARQRQIVALVLATEWNPWPYQYASWRRVIDPIHKLKESSIILLSTVMQQFIDTEVFIYSILCQHAMYSMVQHVSLGEALVSTSFLPPHLTVAHCQQGRAVWAKVLHPKFWIAHDSYNGYCSRKLANSFSIFHFTSSDRPAGYCVFLEYHRFNC